MDDLSDRERKYVQARLLGMTPAQAAKHLGATRPAQEAEVIEARPRVYQALTKGFDEARQRFQVSREEVVEGIKEGIDLARLTSDAGNVIKGWTEIARICGLIAPAKTEVAVSVDQPLLPSKLKELPTEQLLQLVGKRRELEILEAEFEEVSDEETTDGVQPTEAGIHRIHPGTGRGDQEDAAEGREPEVQGVQPAAAEEAVQDHRPEGEPTDALDGVSGMRVEVGSSSAPLRARSTGDGSRRRRRSKEDDQSGAQGESPRPSDTAT